MSTFSPSAHSYGSSGFYDLVPSIGSGRGADFWGYDPLLSKDQKAKIYTPVIVTVALFGALSTVAVVWMRRQKRYAS